MGAVWIEGGGLDKTQDRQVRKYCSKTGINGRGLQNLGTAWGSVTRQYYKAVIKLELKLA